MNYRNFDNELFQEKLKNKLLLLTAKYFRKQSVPFYEKASLKDTIALK